jgi:hypothetical protein
MRDGECEVTAEQAWLADKLGVSVATLNTALAGLKDGQHIHLLSGKDRWTASTLRPRVRRPVSSILETDQSPAGQKRAVQPAGDGVSSAVETNTSSSTSRDPSKAVVAAAADDEGVAAAAARPGPPSQLAYRLLNELALIAGQSEDDADRPPGWQNSEANARQVETLIGLSTQPGSRVGDPTWMLQLAESIMHQRPGAARRSVTYLTKIFVDHWAKHYTAPAAAERMIAEAMSDAADDEADGEMPPRKAAAG